MQPEPEKSATNTASERRLLYICMAGAAPQEVLGTVKSIDFNALTPQTLAAFLPDAVVFPLLSANHDATIIIARLEALGFRGQCLVLSPNLPRPRQIEAELLAFGRGMTVMLLASDAPFPEPI